jgi:CheY-like chemotaxis protein
MAVRVQHHAGPCIVARLRRPKTPPFCNGAALNSRYNHSVGEHSAAIATGDTTRLPAGNVLVIEDDPVVSRLVEHLLVRRGFTVHVAADGLQAQELLKTSPRPAVVVMDVMLPYVSGFELMAEIRRTPGWNGVPVIMLTSKSQERDVLRAFDAGANDYVVKPFRPEEFVARVRRLADN